MASASVVSMSELGGKAKRTRHALRVSEFSRRLKLDTIRKKKKKKKKKKKRKKKKKKKRKKKKKKFYKQGYMPYQDSAIHAHPNARTGMKSDRLSLVVPWLNAKTNSYI